VTAIDAGQYGERDGGYKAGPAVQRSLADPPEEGGEAEGVVGGTAGPASTEVTDNTHNTEDQRHPVVAWLEDHDPPVDIRQARIALRTNFRVDFDDLRTVKDLERLDADRVPMALSYLEALYPPKDGEG